VLGARVEVAGGRLAVEGLVRRGNRNHGDLLGNE
jgi:hypothetical protein